MKVYIIKANRNTKHLSEELFPLVFERETGRKVSYRDLSRNEFGKPQPVDGVYFNISHSGNYWCIVFSDSECGIDIEINRKLSSRIARKILHISEQPIDGNLLKSWVFKEASVKKIGVGISAGLSSVSPDRIEQECVATDLSTDEYVCFAIDNSRADDVIKLNYPEDFSK